MDKKLDVETIVDHIRNVKDVTLKPITDIVALKISKGPYDSGPENNITKAEQITAEYISENYSTLDEFREKLTILDGGLKGIETFAEMIYQSFISSDHLDFETVKNNISSKKDITLKTITDLVAYKISESSDDQGIDLNFISAQTFVAEYVSKNFRNREALGNKISKLGKDMKGLSAFADIIYNHFVHNNT
ncbi:L-lactate permease [Candidatus Scalindua japonica]|uniref:L-lactate permease n=1 Tax=Candidatus Scalindua japonica TaxID=1284222 RepID=A0A286TY48_9BACT|nr:hypothetical protein [Candidatus Scalindua japonica]GAX60829.1 L-lactate permease [Candidatus Scalindua japonica]